MYLRDEFYSGLGGTEQHLLWILRRIPDARIEPHFVVFSSVRACDPKSLPFRPYIIGEECGSGRDRLIRRLLHLANLIRRRRIDIIHAFCLQSERLAVLGALLARRACVVGSRRNVGYALTASDVGFSRTFGRICAGYVANSEAAAQVAVCRERIHRDRITIIPNPVVEERIREGYARQIARESLGVGADDPIVGMVATCRPIKDQISLVQAARTVVDRFPRARFFLVGSSDNDYLKEVQEFTSSLGLGGNVIFYGGIDNPFRIMRHFDVGVLSSRSESFSNAVLEYAAAGVPAVVTDVGGLREIVRDGANGFVVPSGDPASLAAKICILLDSSELRSRFGEYGKRHVHAQFNENVVIGMYREFYEKLLL